MVATGYGLDDKVSKSGDSMTGTLNFLGSPAYTVVEDLHAGIVTLNGTSAVSVATTAVTADSIVQLTVQPSVAPVGTPWVASVTPGTGFTLKSTSASDTAVVVGWSIVEPQ
jgi:hypothetical protein